MSDPSTLAVLAASLVLVGAFGGVLAGLLGVGGGIVVVPALYHIFTAIDLDPAVRMHLAVGTSLATIIPTSIVSVRAHRRRGAVDEALLRGWGWTIGVGALVGTVLAAYVDGRLLTAVFGAVALLVALHMAFSPEGMTLAAAPPEGAVRTGIAGMVGAVSAMMGIGGGTLAVPTLVLSGVPVHRAVGTASAFGLMIAVPGTLGFVVAGLLDHGIGAPPLTIDCIGYVSLLAFALITPTTVLMVPYGAQLAHALPTRMLRHAFAVFLALTAAKMLHSLAG